MGKLTDQFRCTDDTTKRIRSVAFVVTDDQCPDLSYLGEYSDTPDEHHIDRKERGDAGRGEFRYFNLGGGDPAYIEEDYKRMESHNDGHWNMVFCEAVAEVVIGGVIQKVRSGGLGNVESDSDESYFDEIKKDELTRLANILREMGFTTEEISDAYKAADLD